MLNQFSVYTAPVPSGGSVTAKYRIDNETSYTTIGTLSTLGAVSRDFISIEATDTPFPAFKEIQFRLESTGGTEVTGFKILPESLIGSING